MIRMKNLRQNNRADLRRGASWEPHLLLPIHTNSSWTWEGQAQRRPRKRLDVLGRAPSREGTSLRLSECIRCQITNTWTRKGVITYKVDTEKSYGYFVLNKDLTTLAQKETVRDSIMSIEHDTFRTFSVQRGHRSAARKRCRISYIEND